MGTLIICSPRTTTSSQLAVARKQELQKTLPPPASLPQSATVVGNAAIRVAPASRGPFKPPSSSLAPKLELVRGSSSTATAPKDARAYAGVPVRRPRKQSATPQAPGRTARSLPFATILEQQDPRIGRHMATVCAGAAMTLGLVFGTFSVRTVELPNSTAKPEEAALIAPPVITDAVRPATDSPSVSPLSSEQASTQAIPSGVRSETPKSAASVTRPAGAATPKLPRATKHHNEKRCPPGVHSPACAAPLLARYDVDEYRPPPIPMQPDPTIIDPWAGTKESVPSTKRKGLGR